MQVYRLAFSALYTLSMRHDLSINTSALSTVPAYLGVHLHTPTDAVQTGLAPTSYEKQSYHYLLLASLLQFPIIYVATRDAVSTFKFLVEAAAMSPPPTIVTKEDLLSEHEYKELRSMTWDQAALVDHVVLQNAGFFAGTQESAFSWGVAAARAKSGGGEEGICGERNETAKGGSWWRDNWSQIIGDSPHEFQGRLWP
jgi:hypothetical protein